MYKTKSYHGSSPTIIQDILQQGISVNLGGGELGKGFYTGEHLHEAKAWAYHKTKTKKNNVIEFEHNDDDVLELDIKNIKAPEANRIRYKLKKYNQTRTFIFNVDLVWSPIVGTDRVNGIQYKWESDKAEALLNNPTLTGKVII